MAYHFQLFFTSSNGVLFSFWSLILIAIVNELFVSILSTELFIWARETFFWFLTTQYEPLGLRDAGAAGPPMGVDSWSRNGTRQRNHHEGGRFGKSVPFCSNDFDSSV